MIILFFIVLSCDLFISYSFSSKILKTCLLPYVTKPCINDGQNLLCTFSLNSLQRNKTCNLFSFSLIFTTSDIELFVIPQYYDQIILIDEHIITKLIFLPKILNNTYEYLHWPKIRILSIEIPLNISEFIIIHDKHYVNITRTKNQFWNLQLWSTKYDECQRTIFRMYNITREPYRCPYSYTNSTDPVCGIAYTCLNGIPCYFTGYKQIVCEIDILAPFTKFERYEKIFQYEIIFIYLIRDHPNTLHRLSHKVFMINNDIDNPIFITKRLVIIINNGIIQVLSDYSDKLQTRIESETCDNGQFLLDIIDSNEHSTSIDLFDYTTGTNGNTKCLLNINDTTLKKRFEPAIEIDSDTILHAGNSSKLSFMLGGLTPFYLKIESFKSNISSYMSEPPIYIVWSFSTLSCYGIWEIGTVTKYDNGRQFQINVTSRFGIVSKNTRFNVLYEPSISFPLRNQIVKKGSDVILEAYIDGNPPPDVYIQSSNIEQRLYPINNQEFLYQYHLENVQLNQSVSYNFFVVSEYHNINLTETIFLTIFDILYVLNPIDNINIEDDQYLKLTLNFSHSIIKYQWFINDTSIENTFLNCSHYIINNQVVLHIDRTLMNHSGQYKVQVWDILNQTNQSIINIQIYSPPPSIIYCNNANIQYGRSIVILCRFQAKYPQIQWIDPYGKQILDTSAYRIINSTVHIHEADLIFKKVRYENYGIYTLQIKNNGGLISHKINFTLTDMPPIIEFNNFTMKKIYVNQGDSYTFTLTFNGIPWPNVTFFFNNKIFLTYSNPINSTLCLILNNISIINQGIYYTRVMNSVGFIETNRTEISLLQSPKFLRALNEKLEVELGEDLILTINITGNPLPNIQWLFNKQIINNKQFQQYISYNYGIYSLVIHNFTLNDVGNYSVIVTNSENSISSQTEIRLKSSMNSTSSTNKMILNTIKSISNCDDDMARKLLVVLLIALILIVFIPIFHRGKIRNSDYLQTE